MTALLSVNEVSTGYAELEIVHKISIQVDKGEIVTIIGPNGAGKSTLLKAIAGVLTKFEGTKCDNTFCLEYGDCWCIFCSTNR